MKEKKRQVNARGTKPNRAHSRTANRRFDWLIQETVGLDLLVDRVSAAIRLDRWMSRLVDGSSEDLRSPYYRKFSRKEVVGRFIQELKGQLEGSDSSLKTLIFTNLEIPQSEKIGPQSAAKPWDEWGPELVKELYRDTSFPGKLNGRALKRSVERVQSLLPLNSIGMTSTATAIGNRVDGSVESMEHEGMDGTTNSGLPWIIGHWKPGLDERDPEKLEAFRWLVKERVPAVNEELSRGEIVKFAAVASTRMTQKGEGGPSMRLVDALDKAEPIMWKRFTPELLSKLRECGQFVALDDIPFIDLTMQSILDKASESGRTILSGDYSHYDQSLPSGLIELAGTIIANWVRGGRTFVNALVSSMVTSAMVSPSGIVPWRRGGMRSGSGGTNLLDSICNLIVIMYGEEAGFWKVEQAAVQGDDFILDGEGVSPEAIAEVSTLFGLTAHPDKQYFASDSLMFLQRLHIRGKLGGIASTTRTLGSILSYERLVLRPNKWDSEVADTIRARAQLQNAWANPFFEILVKFVSKGDRFKLGGSATMRELLKRAGDSAEAIIRSSLSGQAEIQGGRIDTSSLDAAVIGVLSGKRIPEWGTKSRFEWAYGDRATAARAIEQRKM